MIHIDCDIKSRLLSLVDPSSLGLRYDFRKMDLAMRLPLQSKKLKRNTLPIIPVNAIRLPVFTIQASNKLWELFTSPL